MKDNDYIFSVARIRVKEKTLLHDTDIKSMIGMKDADSVLGYLTSHGWGADSQDKTAEGVLASEEDKTLKMIEELGLDQEILDILSLPKLFHNLKSAIREVISQDSHEQAFYDLSAFDRETALQLITTKNYEAMPEQLRKVAPIAYETMLKTKDSQKCDQLVDKACLDEMYAISQKASSPLLRRYESLQVALADIKIAVRSQKMHKSLNFIKDSLAECSLLDVNELAKAAASSGDDLFQYLGKTEFKDALVPLKKSLSAFEVWCDDQLTILMRSEKNNIATVGPVLAFYLARENEIKTARIILTAKANGFEDSVIEERARLMYV